MENSITRLQKCCGSYREGVDVWAAGVSFFKMVCGYTPFESEYLIQTKDNILGGELIFPEIFNNYNIELKELISKMLIHMLMIGCQCRIAL